MARQKRDGWLEGPPGSKLRMNNMRGGLGTALMVMEQTLLNLPQGEVDAATAAFKELMEDAIKLTKLRMKDLLKSPKQRAFVKMNDISSSLIQFSQAYQTFAGYTSRAVEVPVDAVQEALREVGGQIEAIDGFLVELDRRIEDGRKLLALPEGGSVIDLGADAVESEGEEEGAGGEGKRDPVLEGQLKYLRVNGYLDPEGKLTGKVPPAGAPGFVEALLQEMRGDTGGV